MVRETQQTHVLEDEQVVRQMDKLDFENGGTSHTKIVEYKEASESKDGDIAVGRSSQVLSEKDHKLQNCWEYWFYKRPVKGGEQ